MRSKTLFNLAVACGCLATLLYALLSVLPISAAQQGQQGAEQLANKTLYSYSSGLGIDGYDVVAYFNQREALEGKEQYSVEYAGRNWRFISQENKDAFVAHPTSYLPAFGGHCAYGTSQGYLVSSDPEAWSIKGGVLYLNYSKGVRSNWLRNQAGFIRDANRNWPKLANLE